MAAHAHASIPPTPPLGRVFSPPVPPAPNAVLPPRRLLAPAAPPDAPLPPVDIVLPSSPPPVATDPSPAGLLVGPSGGTGVASSMHNPTNGMAVDCVPTTPLVSATSVVPEAATPSVAEEVLQAVRPVLEAILGRIRDLERQVEGAGRDRTTGQTPGAKHHTPVGRAVAPQIPGHA